MKKKKLLQNLDKKTKNQPNKQTNKQTNKKTNKQTCNISYELISSSKPLMFYITLTQTLYHEILEK